MQTFLRNPASSVRYQSVLAFCALAASLSLAPTVLAQPETFGGNPDSSSFIRFPSKTDDWTRHFRIGAMVGINISASFSMNGKFNISGNNPAQGIYDDGYVRVDNTGNAFGQTGYWGYNDSSQLNGTTLSMHATTSFSAAGNASQDGGPLPGFDMAYGGNLWYWRSARVGWELGFGLLPITISSSDRMSASVNQLTYMFDTGGIIVPGAPYQGGFNRYGEPTIGTSATITTNQASGSVAGSQSLDVMLYTLRLGPSFYWDLSKRVSMSLAAGPAIGIVSGDYKYDEKITGSGINTRNRGQIGGTDLVFGGSVNAAVMYHAVKNGDFFAGVQFMPLTDATISGQGRTGRLNLGGQLYFSVGINWPF